MLWPALFVVRTPFTKDVARSAVHRLPINRQRQLIVPFARTLCLMYSQPQNRSSVKPCSVITQGKWSSPLNEKQNESHVILNTLECFTLDRFGTMAIFTELGIPYRVVLPTQYQKITFFCSFLLLSTKLALFIEFCSVFRLVVVHTTNCQWMRFV